MAAWKRSSKPAAISALMTTPSLKSTLIRSREDNERPLEIQVGNADTATGCRQVFDAVAKPEMDLAA